MTETGWTGSSVAPLRLALAGDWGGNIRWMCHVVSDVAPLLPAHGLRLLIQLGDFGLRPGGNHLMNRLSRTLEEHQMLLWFLDGNHEFHDELDALHEDEPGPVPVDDDGRVWHLPRGTRWEWNDIRWLAVGGAGSPDWKTREEWRPQEVLSEAQADAAVAGGRADVLLAHDCPLLFGPQGHPSPPKSWDFTHCAASERQLAAVTRAVKPSWFVHGHFHYARDELQQPWWGRTRVTGLSNDGGPGNWMITGTALRDFRRPTERPGSPLPRADPG